MSKSTSSKVKSKSKSGSKNKKFCGVGKMPKNSELGSPEYCLETNQVRRYGKVKVSKELINADTEKKKLKRKSLSAEITKLQKIKKKN